MVRGELQAKLVAKVFEEVDFMLIVAMNKVANVDIFVALPIRKCFGNANQVGQNGFDAATTVVDCVGFLSEARNGDGEIPELQWFQLGPVIIVV